MELFSFFFFSFITTDYPFKMSKKLSWGVLHFFFLFFKHMLLDCINLPKLSITG